MLRSKVFASFACLECNQTPLNHKILVPTESAQCGQDIAIHGWGPIVVRSEVLSVYSV